MSYRFLMFPLRFLAALALCMAATVWKLQRPFETVRAYPIVISPPEAITYEPRLGPGTVRISSEQSAYFEYVLVDLGLAWKDLDPRVRTDWLAWILNPALRGELAGLPPEAIRSFRSVASESLSSSEARRVSAWIVAHNRRQVEGSDPELLWWGDDVIRYRFTLTATERVMEFLLYRLWGRTMDLHPFTVPALLVLFFAWLLRYERRLDRLRRHCLQALEADRMRCCPVPSSALQAERLP